MYISDGKSSPKTKNPCGTARWMKPFLLGSFQQTSINSFLKKSKKAQRDLLVWLKINIYRFEVTHPHSGNLTSKNQRFQAPQHVARSPLTRSDRNHQPVTYQLPTTSKSLGSVPKSPEGQTTASLMIPDTSQKAEHTAPTRKHQNVRLLGSTLFKQKITLLLLLKQRC
uniref:(northern house mosquito) hypothetical protein n=1 Tax=Culex pipiens TaxID=7175 RepID=A0A8D8A7U0_CULPI